MKSIDTDPIDSDETASQSTKRANNARLVAGYPAQAGIQVNQATGFPHSRE
jgi:hypothetical protein